MLSEKVMGIGQQDAGKSILITAGAGGVGSIASQLAKHWRLHCITTASRPETVEWTKKHGADIVVNHARGIDTEFKSQGLPPVEYTFNAFGDSLLPQLVPVTRPVVGHIVGINGEFTARELPALCTMWMKRIQCNNELMFAKVRLCAAIAEHIACSRLAHTAAHTAVPRHCVLQQVMYDVAVETQGAILDEVSSLVDSGVLRSHMHDCLSWKEHAKAFQTLEARKTIGKVKVHHSHSHRAQTKKVAHSPLCRACLPCSAVFF